MRGQGCAYDWTFLSSLHPGSTWGGMVTTLTSLQYTTTSLWPLWLISSLTYRSWTELVTWAAKQGNKKFEKAFCLRMGLGLNIREQAGCRSLGPQCASAQWLWGEAPHAHLQLTQSPCLFSGRPGPEGLPGWACDGCPGGECRGKRRGGSWSGNAAASCPDGYLDLSPHFVLGTIVTK